MFWILKLSEEHILFISVSLILTILWILDSHIQVPARYSHLDIYHNFSFNVSKCKRASYMHKQVFITKTIGTGIRLQGLTSCVPIRCYSLSVWTNTSSLLHISHLCSGNNNTYFMGLLWRWKELLHVKLLVKCWAHSKYHGNISGY